MKKYIAIIGLMLGLVLTSNAQTYYATNNLTAGFHTISSTPVKLLSITGYSTNVTPTIVRLYDGWVVSTNAAYTNYTVSSTSKITSYVTTLGTTNLMTNTVLTAVANNVAASTNGTPSPLVSFVLNPGTGTASGDPVTWAPPEGLSAIFSRRLALSNSVTGASFVIQIKAP